jgi:hypothetical protein
MLEEEKNTKTKNEIVKNIKSNNGSNKIVKMIHT